MSITVKYGTFGSEAANANLNATVVSSSVRTMPARSDSSVGGRANAEKASVHVAPFIAITFQV